MLFQLISLFMWFLGGAVVILILSQILPEDTLKGLFNKYTAPPWWALVICGPLLHAWLWHYVWDTPSRRERVSLEIREIVDKSRTNPRDPSYAQELIARAYGRYSFEACKATVAIGEIGDAAIPVIHELADLMFSTDKYVSREAANSLENLGTRSMRVISRLEEFVATGVPDDSTIFAVDAIGNLGQDATRSLPVLRKQLGVHPWLDEHIQRAIEAIEAASGPP